ncbi:MAG: ABC transporter ATP-binding protein [Pseudomonadota bacterium]|nr:ABC transporter ATP-binding protein [Pseudomonadota bacterium]
MVTHTDHILSVQQCTQIYPNGTKAVNDVSFELKTGNFYVLLGLNGAGKSSLINMISGLSRPTSGSIFVSGHDVYLSPFLAKQSIGICPQELNLNIFHTIQEELVIGAGLYGIRRPNALNIIEPLLKKARLWDKRHQLIRNLSGGMKRIVMVLRSMLHTPGLIILDEPTAGLDIEIRELMWSILNKAKSSNQTVLLTTHDLHEAQALCENILLLHHGKLLRNQTIQSAINSLDEEAYVLTFEQPITSKHLEKLSPIKCWQSIPDSPELTLITSTNMPLSTTLVTICQQLPPLKSIMPNTNQLEQVLKRSTV